MQPTVVLTVAANDPLGGAGLGADLATFAALGVQGSSAVTAVTAQRLTSVDRVEWIDPAMVAAQIDSVAAELDVTAVKTGLLGQAETVGLVADRVVAGQLPGPVVDPVLVDGRGEPIVEEEVVAAYRELFSSARVVTPNLAEARLLVGAPAASVDEMAPALAEFGAGLVVVTGGAQDDRDPGRADDALIAPDGRVTWLRSARIDTRNVRGSGCTFAAAVAAGLGLGRGPADAVEFAHRFVRAQLRAAATWEFGGVGPVSHAAEGAVS